MKATPRKVILDNITYLFATHGRSTTEATRLYVEHRISRKDFEEAAQRGLARYAQRNGERRAV